MTIDEVAASYEKSAERYRKAFLHCKKHDGEFYQSEAESNKICYEHDRQLAAWLKELLEYKSQPKIIYCCECKFFRANMSPDGYIPKGAFEFECKHWNGSCDPTDFCSKADRKGGD